MHRGCWRCVRRRHGGCKRRAFSNGPLVKCHWKMSGRRWAAASGSSCVSPKEPQASHDPFGLTHDEPLAAAHLRPDIFQWRDTIQYQQQLIPVVEGLF